MREFSYVALATSGLISRGRMTASAPAAVRQMLSLRGQRLVSIRELNASQRKAPTVASLRFHPFSKPRPADRELLLQQLAVMLGSGLELAPSLRELSRHSPRRGVRTLCAELAESVEQGNSFETALVETAAFPEVVTRLVRVGEQTGELPLMLTRAAEFTEKRRQAQGNLLSALAYPLVVAIAACSVAIYLVGWAIPKLATFLHSLGRQLPAMTQSLLDVSMVVREYGPIAAVALASTCVTFVLVYVWKPGRYRIDQYLLRAPLVGSLLRTAETQQLASSLALMLRSGVFLPDALQTAAALHRNQYLVGLITRSRGQLAMGRDLASTLDDPGFGSMLSSMIAVGERTGELPGALEHVANFYAAQLNSRLQRMARMIEPVIIVVVGGLVGYVYIAFFMALLSAGGKFN